MFLMQQHNSQAQRKHLKIYVQLKNKEQGKQKTLIRTIILMVVIKLNKLKHTYFCESRGTTVDVFVMKTEEQPQVYFMFKN